MHALSLLNGLERSSSGDSSDDSSALGLFSDSGDEVSSKSTDMQCTLQDVWFAGYFRIEAGSCINLWWPVIKFHEVTLCGSWWKLSPPNALVFHEKRGNCFTRQHLSNHKGEKNNHLNDLLNKTETMSIYSVWAYQEKPMKPRKKILHSLPTSSNTAI